MDAREQMTALIAKALHDKECGCGDYDPSAEDESMPYSAQADAVMALFAGVYRERVLMDAGRARYAVRTDEQATHSRFVLRTEPEPINPNP